MYITFDDYKQLYEPIEERVFNLLAYDACRMMDIHTTGIDNVKKLKLYFPADEDDVQSVKRCAAKLVHFLNQIREVEMAVNLGKGYEVTEQGIRGKKISSVSAGNESITYADGYSNASIAFLTEAESAAKDKSVKDKLVAGIIWECLSGVEDANGVNLLFMGRYPRRY